MTRSAPKPVGESIRALRAAAEPATLLAAVQSSWEAAVGPAIARQARPVRERDGTVTVECSASTWAQELDLLQRELIERLNLALGEARVSRLRTIVGDRDDFGTQ